MPTKIERLLPDLSSDVRTLIRTMSQANPLWGAPRIHGELLKLGIAVSQATVAKYMLRDVTQREPQHDSAATPCAAGTG